MVSEHPDGVIVEIWVIPGASRDSIDGVHDGALRVRITAPPEGGKANRAAAGLVAAHLGARRAEVIDGAVARRKRVLVFGVTLIEAKAVLANADR